MAGTRTRTKDTVLCISLAARPTSIGTRFHNFLYEELSLDYVYKACTTSDIAAAIGGMRALGIRGCGVSMPWKQDVLGLVDAVDRSAEALGAANTIVNDAGRLTAYNTDYVAVRLLLTSAAVGPTGPAAVVGNGGMARACAAALRDHGFADGLVVARNEVTGRAVASSVGWRWVPAPGAERFAVLLNATPVGMAPSAGAPDHSGELPVAAEVVARAGTVVDAVAHPPQTPLVGLAREHGIPVVTGAQITALQAAEQFALYTGVRPSEQQVQRAAEYSRAG